MQVNMNPGVIYQQKQIKKASTKTTKFHKAQILTLSIQVSKIKILEHLLNKFNLDLGLLRIILHFYLKIMACIELAVIQQWIAVDYD